MKLTSKVYDSIHVPWRQVGTRSKCELFLCYWTKDKWSSTQVFGSTPQSCRKQLILITGHVFFSVNLFFRGYLKTKLECPFACIRLGKAAVPGLSATLDTGAIKALEKIVIYRRIKKINGADCHIAANPRHRGSARWYTQLKRYFLWELNIFSFAFQYNSTTTT